ncbi:MAG: hypothetical protein ACRC4M_00790 [Mycoplasma sp.]
MEITKKILIETLQLIQKEMESKDKTRTNLWETICVLEEKNENIGSILMMIADHKKFLNLKEAFMAWENVSKEEYDNFAKKIISVYEDISKEERKKFNNFKKQFVNQTKNTL